LAYHLDLVGIAVHLGRAGGGSVGLEDEMSAAQGAPGAGVSVAKVEEINGTVVLAGPASRLDLAACFVDLYEGARLKQRVHHPIVGANAGIAMLLDLEGVEQGEGHLAPLLNHAAQVGSAAQVEAGVELQRQGNRSDGVGVEADGIGLGRRDQGGILSDVLQIHAVPAQHFVDIQPVDGTERIKPIESREGALVLDVGESAEGYDKLGVVVALRDSRAGLLHLPVPETQIFPNLLQPETCVHLFGSIAG